MLKTNQPTKKKKKKKKKKIKTKKTFIIYKYKGYILKINIHKMSDLRIFSFSLYLGNAIEFLKTFK